MRERKGLGEEFLCCKSFGFCTYGRGPEVLILEGLREGMLWGGWGRGHGRDLLCFQRPETNNSITQKLIDVNMGTSIGGRGGKKGKSLTQRNRGRRGGMV